MDVGGVVSGCFLQANQPTATAAMDITYPMAEREPLHSRRALIEQVAPVIVDEPAASCDCIRRRILIVITSRRGAAAI